MPQESPPSDNIYISDLPTGLDDDSLRQIFEAYGQVVRCRMLQPTSPTQTQGCGLVRFDSIETATWVKENLHGNIPQGLTSPVRVKFANPPAGKGGMADRWPAPYPGGGAAAEGGGHDTVYITSLPENCPQEEVHRVFQQYGQVVFCKVTSLPDQGVTAIIKFATIQEATWVKENVHGGIPMGMATPVSVQFIGALAKTPGNASSGYAAIANAAAAAGGKGAAGTAQRDNLYIKGLPGTTDEKEVSQIFSQYGTVTQVKVFNYANSQSCSALVRFATEEEAQWVKDNLNGNVPQGYPGPVEVRHYDAKPAAQAPFGGKGGMQAPHGSLTQAVAGVQALAAFPALNGKGEGKGSYAPRDFSMKDVVLGFEKSGGLPGAAAGYTDPQCMVYIGGLPPDAEDDDLFRLFNSFGAIMPTGVKVMKTPEGSCKGFGFVDFQEVSAAQAAIQLFNGTILPDGNTLLVKVKQSRGKGGWKGDKGGGNDWKGGKGGGSW